MEETEEEKDFFQILKNYINAPLLDGAATVHIARVIALVGVAVVEELRTTNLRLEEVRNRLSRLGGGF